MKKLEEIINENIGDKEYLWIYIPHHNCPCLNMYIKDMFYRYMELNNAKFHFYLHKLPQFVYVDRNKNVYYKIHLWINKEFENTNKIKFSPSWLNDSNNNLKLNNPKKTTAFDRKN